MTIKINKLKPDKSVVKRCICDHCGATLEYTPNDVTYATYKDYGGGSDVYAEFNCPNCNKKLQICQ
jgi:hypothetical protein